MSARLMAAPGEVPAELARMVQALVQPGRTALVAVDGRCGSGKTALGTALGRMFGCPVVHTDDYYLPFARRARNWREVPAANMDFARLRAEVLDPLRAGREGVYRAYDCHADCFADEEPLPAGPLLVLEGSYSHHPDLGGYDLTVFVTCPAACREQRLRTREGEHYEMFRSCWIPLEEGYFARYGVENKADCVVDTGAAGR